MIGFSTRFLSTKSYEKMTSKAVDLMFIFHHYINNWLTMNLKISMSCSKILKSNRPVLILVISMLVGQNMLAIGLTAVCTFNELVAFVHHYVNSPLFSMENM